MLPKPNISHPCSNTRRALHHAGQQCACRKLSCKLACARVLCVLIVGHPLQIRVCRAGNDLLRALTRNIQCTFRNRILRDPLDNIGHRAALHTWDTGKQRFRSGLQCTGQRAIDKRLVDVRALLHGSPCAGFHDRRQHGRECDSVRRPFRRLRRLCGHGCTLANRRTCRHSAGCQTRRNSRNHRTCRLAQATNKLRGLVRLVSILDVLLPLIGQTICQRILCRLCQKVRNGIVCQSTQRGDTRQKLIAIARHKAQRIFNRTYRTRQCALRPVAKTLGDIVRRPLAAAALLCTLCDRKSVLHRAITQRQRPTDVLFAACRQIVHGSLRTLVHQPTERR